MTVCSLAMLGPPRQAQSTPHRVSLANVQAVTVTHLALWRGQIPRWRDAAGLRNMASMQGQNILSTADGARTCAQVPLSASGWWPGVRVGVVLGWLEQQIRALMASLLPLRDSIDRGDTDLRRGGRGRGAVHC
jgi:hypothetical protein